MTMCAVLYKERTRYVVAIICLFALLLAVGLMPTIILAQTGLGSMVTEKTLARSGQADSNLLLACSTGGSALSIIGFAPSVQTSNMTDQQGAGASISAKLHGIVTDMHGLSSATGYFQWGHSPSALINTTTTVTITGAGDYGVTITGYTGDSVYYRFVTDADGESIGSILDFVNSNAAAGNVILRGILRVLLAAVVIVGVVAKGRGNPLVMMLAVLIGIIAFAFVDQAIISNLI